ncbi:MAG: hypothetical protein KBS81_07110, partial [Spirochaetales bacterium]|nr:hypothetical protein [Candidatus Physcosoma equi]
MSKKNNSKAVGKQQSSLWTYATLAYSAFILVLFPLMTDQSGFTAITKFKFRTFLWSSLVYFGAVVLPMIYVWIIKNPRNLSLRKSVLPKRASYTQLFLIFYTMWAAASAILSPYGKQTFMGQGRYDGLISYLLYTFVFLFVSFWAENHENYLRGMAVTGIVFSFISILQLFVKGIINSPGYWFWTQPYMGTIGNVDMVAGFAALYIPILISSYVFEEDKRWNPVFLVSIGTFMFAQAIGDADSGKVGILFGLLITLPFLLDRKARIKKTPRALAA